MSELIIRTPAKVMIAGEYSVLFGGIAIVAAVGRFAKARFKPGPQIRFFSQQEAHTLEQNDNPLWQAVKKAACNNNIVLNDGNYWLNTKSFYHKPSGQKYGIGSSAAGMVSLCKLILEQHGQACKESICQLAFEAHRIFSNELGSGADIAACIESRPILYKRSNARYQTYPVALKLLWPHLIFVFTNKAQNTRPFVAQALKLEEDGKSLEAFRASSNFLCSLLLQEREPAAVIEIFTELYLLLENLGKRLKINIVGPEHQEIHRLAKDFNGAAKPSGAGGGDLCLVFMPKNKNQFIKKCRERGFSILKLPLAELE